MKVIAISGRSQSGKDAFARMAAKSLMNRKYKTNVIHYADLLKYILRTYCGWNGKKDETGRTMLQHIGTDVMRAKDEDYFVRFVGDMLSFFGDKWDYVFIPDVRFPNEIDHLRKRGFDVIYVKVERPNFQNKLTDEQRNHASEISMDNIPADHIIRNVGTLKDFKKTINQWLREEILEEKNTED